MPTFRWGIIGPGRIAHQFAAAFAAVDDGCVQAVASRDLRRAERFARQHGVPRWLDDYQALIDDPSIDAVYIATPHHAHAPWVRQCLLAGKPVLCEKPLTVNAAQTEALVRLASERGVFMMEAMWSRFLPAWRRVRAWLDADAIGEVRVITSSFGFALPAVPTDRWLDPAQAGGVLLDMGVYNLSLSQWVMGEEPVGFDLSGTLARTGVDARVAATLRYGDGGCSQFVCNFEVGTGNEMRIAGRRGEIRVPANFWHADRVVIRRGLETTTLEQPLDANGYEYEIREVMRCVRAGLLESPGMRQADTLATMRLMDAMRAHMGVRYPDAVEAVVDGP